jgi:hypothetical protein
VIEVKDLENMGDPDFEQFWAAYPRKEARKDAGKAWMQMTPEQKFAARESIPIHVRYWEVSERSRHYIPLPATWLRGERWTDELPMPESQTQAEWWRSTAGIEAKAREMGMWPPRAGEDWHSLKARILARKVAS